MRRSSRSVCGNLAEAWRKRRHEAAFGSRLDEMEGEAAETQTWLQFAEECGYWERDAGEKLRHPYDRFLGELVNMISNP